MISSLSPLAPENWDNEKRRKVDTINAYKNLFLLSIFMVSFPYVYRDMIYVAIYKDYLEIFPRNN